MSRNHVIAFVLFGLGIPPCAAYGDRFIVPYYGAYGVYNAPYRSDDALELARIRRELREQRRLDHERARRSAVRVSRSSVHAH